MKDDPIVAEVRAIRDELAAQCGYDLKKILRWLREQQASSGRQYVRYPARRIIAAKDRRSAEPNDERVQTEVRQTIAGSERDAVSDR